MFSIEQSLFLQALGHAIGSSLWQVAALWLAYAIISSISRLSASRKYQLAAGASLVGLAWFIVTFIQAYTSISLPQQLAGGMYAEAAETGHSFPDRLVYFYNSVLESVKSLAPYISCAYLLMFILLCIRLSNSFKQIRFITTQGLDKVNVELRLFVKENAARLGISRPVKIFTSQHVEGPLTMGFWKPIILMPVACLSHLTVTEVEAILLHELAHIRRHDYLVNIFLQIAEISLFFNPFMRLLLKQVKQERENSCDDYVLQFEYSPKDYAKALLAIEHSSNTALLALAAKGNQSFQLLNRVKRMVAPQPKAFNYRQQLGLLLLFTLLMLGFTVIVPRPQKALDKSNKLATAIAKKINPEKQKSTVAIVENHPMVVPAPPAPPRAFNLIDNITNHPNADVTEQVIDVEALEDIGKKMEMQEKEIEALGFEIKEKMQPFTDKINAWANSFADATDNQLTSEHLTALANLKELKTLPIEALTEISEDYQKTIGNKLNQLLKTIPAIKRVALIRSATGTQYLRQASSVMAQAATKEKLAVTGRADFVRQQASKNNYTFRELQNAVKVKMPEIQTLQKQAEAKQREALAKMDRLHLGLLTDDRDTCIAECDGLVAKATPRRSTAYNLQFKANSTFYVPQEVRINGNGKHTGRCVITVTENNVKITSEDGLEEPINFNTNGQNIDIRHEKQINNGKEEKVVIISINNSR